MKRLRLGSYRSEPGESYGTPKEIWGFRTAPQAQPARRVAAEFLQANAALLELTADLGDLKYQKTLRSLAARHVILQQWYAGRRIHRAYVSVHLSGQGSVYLAKNRAVPQPLLPKRVEFSLTATEAFRRARRGLPAPRRPATVQSTEEIWFPRGPHLLPSWRVRILRTQPREEWIVYVHARTGGILSWYDNLAKTIARGRVFDPSPVTALGSHASLLTAGQRQRKPPHQAYRTVPLRGLEPTGYLDGKRVTTRATAAHRRVRRLDGQFLFEATEPGFEEVMAYYHLDRVLHYLERLGFRGARAIFRQPLLVNVNGSREDNSWYSPTEKQITLGQGAIDDAEDGETIVHELGHAVQDAIVPDFGQSVEAAAMGEGFGDYLAASFFADQKPLRYRTSVMTWDGLLLGLQEDRDPPCLRRVDLPRTYGDFEPQGAEHDNGTIWSATLWDVRELLGRERADRVILESHFQLDGFTRLARGARGILDANDNLYRGEDRPALMRLFARRKIKVT